MSALHAPDWRVQIIEARNARLAEMAAYDTAPDRELTRAELAELALPGWLRNEAAPACDREGSATNQEVKS